MFLFGQKQEQEGFDDFKEEIYILEDTKLVKQEGENDAENITKGNE